MDLDDDKVWNGAWKAIIADAIIVLYCG